MDIVLRIPTTGSFTYSEFLVDMINKVYIESEGDIWLDGHERINLTRLAEIVEKKELLIAESGNEIAGCVHLERVDSTTFKFKMLVANPKFKGMGIGSLLVDYAERTAVDNGAKIMRLELLDTTDFVHPDKVFLKNWYTRIGYKFVSEHDVDYVHAGLSKLLKTGCIAEIYHKVIN